MSCFRRINPITEIKYQYDESNRAVRVPRKCRSDAFDEEKGPNRPLRSGPEDSRRLIRHRRHILAYVETNRYQFTPIFGYLENVGYSAWVRSPLL
jgi:hypothetical protein